VYGAGPGRRLPPSVRSLCATLKCNGGAQGRPSGGNGGRSAFRAAPGWSGARGSVGQRGRVLPLLALDDPRATGWWRAGHPPVYRPGGRSGCGPGHPSGTRSGTLAFSLVRWAVGLNCGLTYPLRTPAPPQPDEKRERAGWGGAVGRRGSGANWWGASPAGPAPRRPGSSGGPGPPSSAERWRVPFGNQPLNQPGNQGRNHCWNHS
jgi:hypothetical protein